MIIQNQFMLIVKHLLRLYVKNMDCLSKPQAITFQEEDVLLAKNLKEN